MDYSISAAASTRAVGIHPVLVDVNFTSGIGGAGDCKRS